MAHVLAIEEVLELFHDDVSCHEALELMEHLNSALMTAHEDQGEVLMQAWELVCDILGKTLPLTDDHEGEWQYVGLDLLTEIRHLVIQCMVNLCELCGSDMVSMPVVSLLLSLTSSLTSIPGSPAPQHKQTANDWARLVYVLGAHQGQQGIPTGIGTPFGTLLRAAFTNGPPGPTKAVSDTSVAPSTGIWRLLSDERRGNLLESLWHAIRQQSNKEDAAILLLIHRQLLTFLAAGDLSAECSDAIVAVSAGFVSSQSCAAFSITQAWHEAQAAPVSTPVQSTEAPSLPSLPSAPVRASMNSSRRRSLSAGRASLPAAASAGTHADEGRERERMNLSAALLQRRNELRNVLSEKSSDVPSPLPAPPRSSQSTVWPLQCLYHCVQDGCVQTWLKLLHGHCMARYEWHGDDCKPLLLSTFSQRALIRSITRIFLVIPSLLSPNLPRLSASRVPVWSAPLSVAVRTSCLSIIRCLITAATQAQAQAQPQEVADVRDTDAPVLMHVRLGSVGIPEESGGEGGQAALLGDALQLLAVLQKVPMHDMKGGDSTERAS
jgi:hypothetical protein